MSKELFEMIMKEIHEQAVDLNYSDGAAAGDWMATFFHTLDSEFWKREQAGDERGVRDSKDFQEYAKRQMLDCIETINKDNVHQ